MPSTDTHTAPIQAMERLLNELPLDGCEIRRSAITDGLEYVAPLGKAFRIFGPGMEVGRFKDNMTGSRSEADGTIPKDPLAVDEDQRFNCGVIQEHVATILALKSYGPGFFGRRLDNDRWTENPISSSSDEVSVEISLRDQPQAWSWIGRVGIAFRNNNSPYSKGRPVIFADAENRQIGYRQATVAGKAGEVKVELVDIDYAAMKTQDKIYSVDGRELQIAGSPLPNTELLESSFDFSTAEEYDDWWMGKMREIYSLAHFPREQRIRLLWRSKRDIISGEDFRPAPQHFSDDPLRDFDIVKTDPVTGKVADVSRLVKVVKQSAKLTMMSYAELEGHADEAEVNPNPDNYRKYGKKMLEPIPFEGSIGLAVSNYCSQDWELEAGQRGNKPTLFGWFTFPKDMNNFRSYVDKHSLEDVVEKYASTDWRIQEIRERRITAKPLSEDVYLRSIDTDPLGIPYCDDDIAF